MDHHDTDARFQTTSWSLVRRATSSIEDLDALLRIYWSPVYAYIRRSGRNRNEAADHTQEFLTRIILERGLLEKADPDRGRFRALMKTALGNFLIDEARRERSRKKHLHTSFLPRDETALNLAEPAADEAPADAFDRQWATTVLDQALERVRAECQGELAPHWRAFEANILGPAIQGSSPIPMKDLADEIGADSPEQVSSMIQTIKRKFRRALRDVVATTVDGESEIEAELELMRRALGL